MTGLLRPTVAADVRGTGDPVLLLHGIGGCAATFTALAALLDDAGFRAIAWDAPGYGASDDPTELLGRDGYLRALTTLLSEHGETSAHVIGTSWGGVLGTCLAAARPERVRSLTLLDSTRGSGVQTARAHAMRSRVDELATVGAVEFASRRAHRLVAPGADRAVADEVVRQMAGVRVPGYRAAAEFMADTDTTALLSDLETPTLVLVGEHDRVTGVAESELLASRIPGARFAVIADAGHAAVQERPESVASAVTTFLAEVATRPSIGVRS
ncbi:alpha/beta fold hydrolase [Leekyejoonella antrihumi]|uniref:Alpha/beta hydrolase n=1 Tax=Leekyejoonella antrihumi TaxID=1660198 RepID=A0A563DXJ8_9MICO|nr:alpha/beta hydrolase [Leekyejoonella antrihumi]TWP34682.1 alpha/beta hydrolase [Leekyejoonella antrihumi]